MIVPTQQSDAMGTALKQEKLKGYITALRVYNLPRSGLVLPSITNMTVADQMARFPLQRFR